jgi:putative acetyltransferase
VIIRLYVPHDIDDLMELFRDSVRQVASKDYSPAQVQAWAPDELDRDLWLERRGSRPTWVAVIDGRIAGFTDLEPDGHVDMMFVHPDFQGRRVASSLLRHAEAEAVDLGLKRLFTEASITAKPFFERRGFRELAEQQVSVRGQVLTNYRMEKLLP